MHVPIATAALHGVMPSLIRPCRRSAAGARKTKSVLGGRACPAMATESSLACKSLSTRSSCCHPIGRISASVQIASRWCKRLIPPGHDASEGASCFAGSALSFSLCFCTCRALGGKSLAGQLPFGSNVWNNLPELTNLDLSSNNVGGYLPPAISSLKKLQTLNLNGNVFNGEQRSGCQCVPHAVQVALYQTLYVM